MSAFKTGKIVCVTGVSGSGKSTLVRDIFYQNIKKNFHPEKHLLLAVKK